MSEEEARQLRAENERLRLRIQSAAGDDLCRLTQEEIKAYTSGAVQIPPREEFIPSCERFHQQMAEGPGVLNKCLTLAQMIAENERLRAELDALSFEAMGRPGVLDVPLLGEILQDRIDAQRKCGKLAADNERLRAALKPFAHDLFIESVPDNEIAFGGPMVRVGDYRRAVAALATS